MIVLRPIQALRLWQQVSLSEVRDDAPDLTLRQMPGALEKSGVQEVAPAVGERFDPHRHQAMAVVESDAEPNTVASLMQKGYLLHDRVLRPALVTVAKPRVENEAENPTSNTDLD